MKQVSEDNLRRAFELMRRWNIGLLSIQAIAQELDDAEWRGEQRCAANKKESDK